MQRPRRRRRRRNDNEFQTRERKKKWKKKKIQHNKKSYVQHTHIHNKTTQMKHKKKISELSIVSFYTYMCVVVTLNPYHAPHSSLHALTVMMNDYMYNEDDESSVLTKLRRREFCSD